MSFNQRYTDGLQMEQFRRIEEVSRYNYNYHVGFDQDLLLAQSDDDDTTEWFLILGKTFHYLGESYCTSGDRLNCFWCLVKNSHNYDQGRT